MITQTEEIFDIASRVAIHDIHQFEIKLEYNLEDLGKTNNYKIETFLFIPNSLQIDETTYPHTQFYKDLRNYIRFKTPSYSFKLILDPGFVHSPLNVLRNILRESEKEIPQEQRVDNIRKCIKELKMLGIMVRARLRDFRIYLKNMLEKSAKKPQYILKRFDDNVFSGIKVLEELREIKKEFTLKCPDEAELFKYFSVLEEFLSYLLEEDIVGIFKIIDKKITNDPYLNDLKDKLRHFFKEEKTLRKEEGFNLLFKNTEEAKEQYIYYMSQYKKIIASVLYLEIERSTKNFTYTHLIGSAAAFTASMIYLAIVVFIAGDFAINSLPFVLIISLGYVFKDRIKDIIKLILNPKVLSHFPDHITQIKDMSGKYSVKLGDIREKVFFNKREKTDPMVIGLRDKTRPTAFLPEESMESILVYQKEINVNTHFIREKYSRTINLTDIMRFNIHKYLEKMDDPQQNIFHYDEKNDQFISGSGERSYHIGLVIKYSKLTDKTDQLRYERYRIVANKWGIKRVEFVERI
jgi:hypothetical protein